MSDKATDTTAAYQVELAINRLESLSTLPCVAAQLFPKLLKGNLSSLDLAEIIESDPALTSKVFSVAGLDGNILEDGLSVRQILEKLDISLLRDTVLSVQVAGSFGADSGAEMYKVVTRKQLFLHCLAVAICAKDIAEIAFPQMDSQLAYSAGLLHDIGKLALDQTMPKSFEKIVREAKMQSAGSCTIEQKYLGLDHTIIGKRLAQKWGVPEQIVLAIWLHHSDTAIISQNIGEAKIAQIVQLADIIARQCSIGQSCSFDSPDSPYIIARSLNINSEQMQKIRRSLIDGISEKSELLGLDSKNIAANYCQTVHAAIAQLAHNNTKLSLENRRLQASSGHFDFATEFLSSITSMTSSIEAAEKFAISWQNFYQTGSVCLYLVEGNEQELIKAVVVEGQQATKKVILNAPSARPIIPRELTRKFDILDADGNVNWLFEQLDTEFELSQTKIIPLLCSGKAIGAMIFEFRYPVESKQLQEKFRATAAIGGIALGMTFSSNKQQHFAEQFASFLNKVKTEQRHQASEELLEALAEMAAGAAHELNNPLSVISGRAQLLGKSEADSEKKQILEQIKENTDDLAGIIDGLMNFARPKQPRPDNVDIQQILDEAVELASKKTNTANPDIQVDVSKAGKEVFVDSAQMASAISNILANAIESYPAQAEAIKVTAVCDEGSDILALEIVDMGSGMDSATLQKAIQPFFSAKPAGRKRGMGLAYANRLIQLNKGTLNITSQLASGTTVTVSLPCK